MEEKYQVYLLGEFSLDVGQRQLSRAGAKVHLTPLPFQVLVYLIEHRDRLVTRDELLARFWEGRDVYDDSLRKAVGAIRKALDDRQELPRFIETRYGEGYRYVGPLAEPHEAAVKDDEAPFIIGQPASAPVVPSAPALPRLYGRMAAVFGLAAGLVILLAVASAYRGNTRGIGKSAAPSPSLAVLPLKNLSGDPAQEYFSDGLTEHLINTLAKIEGLKVIARGSAFTFKGQEVDPREVGKTLGVAAVLQGSVLRSGERVRVEVRLVDAEDGRVLWASDTSEHRLGDIFALQDEIARRAAEGLRVNLGMEGEQRLARRDTDNPEAYQAYLKGRYFLNQRTPEAVTRSLDYFRQAIAISPNYALAYAGLAEAHNKAFWFIGMRPEELAKEREAATRALELDDSLAEAHVAMASVDINQWNLPSAVKGGARAITISPGDAEAHHVYAYALIQSGKPDEAVAEIKRARELDPLNVVMNVDVGEILLYARRYDEAIEALKHAIEMDAGRRNAYYDLGLAYEQKGLYAEALVAQLKNESLNGLSQDALAALKQAYDQSGMRGFWRKRLALTEESAKSHYIAPILLAELYAHIGSKDQAFAYLEKAYAERSPALANLKIEATLDPLRSDPRYTDLLRRVGLPE